MRTYRIAAVVALAVQCWALYVPRPPSVESGLPLDKVVHMGVFAVVTWLGLQAGWRWIVPAMVVQAAASELVQNYFLPSRGGDWFDFLADLAGIALGWAVWRGFTVRNRSFRTGSDRDLPSTPEAGRPSSP